MDRKTVVIGTRGSRLALAQAGEVTGELRLAFPETMFMIKRIRTSGDRLITPPGAVHSAQGLFVKEIEEELATGGCDIAVHSLKDMPTEQPPGLIIAAVTKRADPFDVLISRNGEELLDLPPGARLGTSSPRRAALILGARPDITIVPIRGNVETRMRKMNEGACDAIVLAGAGLERLGMKGYKTQRLTPPSFLPAPGQGCLALETRDGDAGTISIARTLNHPPSYECVMAERALLSELGGGCRVPIAAYAELLPGNRALRLLACVLSPDGRKAVREEIEGKPGCPEEIAAGLARMMRGKGADRILESI